jgi:hypothetical protein
MEHRHRARSAVPLGDAALLRENERLRAELDAAKRALTAMFGGYAEPMEPPPEFTLAYESPLRHRFTPVWLPGGDMVVLDRDQVGRRSAAEVWRDVARLMP